MYNGSRIAAVNQQPPELVHVTPPPGPQWVTPTPKSRPEVAELFGSLVRDIMTRKVTTVEPTDTLRFAATLLSQKGISGMPVVAAEGRIVGVLSEKDILRTLKDKAGLGLPGGLFELILEPAPARQKDLLTRCRATLDEVRVATAMTAPARTVHPDSPSVEAIREMTAARVNRLPVIERGKLVGIVTRGDLLRLSQTAY